MKAESLVFAIAGVFLGLIAGWLIGSQQQPRTAPAAVPQAAQAASTAQGTASATPPPPQLDEAEAKRLADLAERDPSNATPRTQLGNLYFDAERYARNVIGAGLDRVGDDPAGP